MKLPQKNWLEWMVFAAGACLIIAVIAFLVYDAATMGTQPPTIEARAGAPRASANSFIVPVTVTNHGDETAEGVQVEVELTSPEGGEPERGEFEIPLLPRRATREGSVMFRRDPRAARLDARVTGFGKP